VIRVTENFRKIQDLLAKAAVEAGRAPETVKLLAASKSQPADIVLEAASCGQLDFGENFVQEAISKMQGPGRDNLIWHFIGRLQSIQTRSVAEHFAWVHTVDRLKIAQRLSSQRPHYAEPLNVCVQINIDNESGKSGAAPEDAVALAQAVAALPRLELRGFMCIPEARHEFSEQRKPFAKMRALADTLRTAGVDTDTLSMGMTLDYAAAIREGATIVRIGTALFGPRKASNK